MAEVSELLSSSRQFVDELERHREVWESCTHWFARKTFLRHNWEGFEDKVRLICLSHAWANISFSGNRYPREVMLQVRRMAEGMESAEELLIEAERKDLYK